MSNTSDDSAAKAELAVFDLDGTCIDGQSGWLISTYLLSRGIVNFLDAARLFWWGARYKLHLPHRQQEAREIILGALNRHGLRAEEVDALMAEFHDAVLVPLYRPEAIEEVRRRCEEGKTTLLASATFNEVAASAAAYLQLDGFIATEMERDGLDRYTGRVEGEVIEGKGKLRAVARWSDEHFGEGRWIIACAYGDHHSDSELLSAAREAYVVCPDKTLKNLAQRRDWPVLMWSDVA